LWISLLFRQNELVAVGELEPVLLSAMLDYQLLASGQKIEARDGWHLTFLGFFRPRFRIQDGHQRSSGLEAVCIFINSTAFCN
jgi:hypothetical protein